MLDRQPHAAPTPSPASRQRFLGSVYGVLGELKTLLIESADPISAETGAQIVQMLRAMREGASTHGLDDVAHTLLPIEMYLISGEAYGPNGALRNVILGSRVEELMDRVADAVHADRPAWDHGQRLMSAPSPAVNRRAT